LKNRYRSSKRAGISDARFGAVLAAFTLVLIVFGLSFSSVASSQLGQIRALQGQLASAATSTAPPAYLVSNRTTGPMTPPFTGVLAVTPTGVTRHFTLII
jgi:hypothetical protein